MIKAGQAMQGMAADGRPVARLLGSAAVALALFATVPAQAQQAKAPDQSPRPQTPAVDPEPAQAVPDADSRDIVVTADRKNSFSADYVQAGSFRGARQLDTPLTVSVIPETVLRSQQATGLLDALRNSAGVVPSGFAPTVYSNLSIRGITVENRSNYRLNGTLPVVNLLDLPLENKFRVEALKGASSLYYGLTTPGGIVNLTTKRPTEKLFGSFRLSGNAYGQAVAAAEVSDTMGPIGVRLTGVVGALENGITQLEGNRDFVSAAVDIKPLDGLVVALDAERIHKKITDPTLIALVATAPVVPSLLDPSINLGAKYFYTEGTETNYLAHVSYRAAPWVSFSADVGQSRLTRDRSFSTFTFCTTALCPKTLYPNGFTASDGVLVDMQTKMNYNRNRTARAETAFDFAVGPFKNNLVFGYSYNKRLQQIPQTANSAATNYLGTITYAQNYFNPTDALGAYLPLVPGTTTLRSGQPAKPGRLLASFDSVEDQGYYVFGRIEAGSLAQFIGGARKVVYKERNELTNTPTFSTNPVTLSGSVVLKPLRWASVYGSYIEGLETTRPAPLTAANPNVQLPASPSTQYEAGIKVEPIRSFLLTAAYFDIRRTSASVNPTNNIYDFIGKARFRGVELSATGEVTPNLSLYATALFLDPKQVEAATASLANKIIENTAKHTWSASAQYRIPMIPGLAVSAGGYYTGRRAVNATNLAFIPGYTLFDLGGSYTTKLSGANVTFRLNGENITGKRYYAATGSSQLSEGLPSVVKFGIETSF